jgi:hypothetical protein
MKVHGPLPRGEALTVSASVAVGRADGRPRARGGRHLHRRPRARPNWSRRRLHMSFLLPGKRGARPAPARPPDPAVDRPPASGAPTRSDGLRFALLSGDFNPIHWCGPLARLSVFGGTVLHGFGSLARSIEALRRLERRLRRARRALPAARAAALPAACRCRSRRADSGRRRLARAAPRRRRRHGPPGGRRRHSGAPPAGGATPA